MLYVNWVRQGENVLYAMEVQHLQRYPIYELEALALVEAIKLFHPYLTNTEFQVFIANLWVKYIKEWELALTG